jgi:hypothetical protein
MIYRTLPRPLHCKNISCLFTLAQQIPNSVSPFSAQLLRSQPSRLPCVRVCVCVWGYMKVVVYERRTDSTNEPVYRISDVAWRVNDFAILGRHTYTIGTREWSASNLNMYCNIHRAMLELPEWRIYHSCTSPSHGFVTVLKRILLIACDVRSNLLNYLYIRPFTVSSNLSRLLVDWGLTHSDILNSNTFIRPSRSAVIAATSCSNPVLSFRRIPSLLSAFFHSLRNNLSLYSLSLCRVCQSVALQFEPLIQLIAFYETYLAR